MTKTIKVRRPRFSTFQVARMFKIKRPTLQDWLARGYISPDIEATGVGTRAKFSYFNLLQIQLFHHLIRTGFSRITASRMVKQVTFDWLYELSENTNIYPNDEFSRAFFEEDEDFTIYLIFIALNKGFEINAIVLENGQDTIELTFDRDVRDIKIVDFSDLERATREAINELK